MAVVGPTAASLDTLDVFTHSVLHAAWKVWYNVTFHYSATPWLYATVSTCIPLLDAGMFGLQFVISNLFEWILFNDFW